MRREIGYPSKRRSFSGKGKSRIAPGHLKGGGIIRR